VLADEIHEIVRYKQTRRGAGRADSHRIDSKCFLASRRQDGTSGRPHSQRAVKRGSTPARYKPHGECASFQESEGKQHGSHVLNHYITQPPEVINTSLLIYFLALAPREDDTKG
jgi:hypothetical protein